MAEDMTDAEEYSGMSDDMPGDSSDSEAENMSVPTTSDESDEYGSKEKRRCKHNHDALMVNL